MNNWELPQGDTGGVDFYPEFRPDYSSQYTYSHAPPPPYSRSSNDCLMYASNGNYPPTTSVFQSLPRQPGHHHVHCHPMPERATQTLPRTAQGSPQVRKSVQRKTEKEKKEGFLASLKRKLSITRKPKPRKEKWEANGKAKGDGPGPVMTSTPVTTCSRKHSRHQRSPVAPLQRSSSCGGEHSLASTHMPPSSCTSGTGWSPVMGKADQNYRTSALRQQQQQRWSFAGPPPPPPSRPLSQISTAAPHRPASVTGYQEHGIYPQSLRERELAFLHQDQDISDHVLPSYPEPVYGGSLGPPVPPNYHQHYDTLSLYSSGDQARSLNEYSQGGRQSFTSHSSSASQYSTGMQQTGLQYASSHTDARLLNPSQQQVPVHYTSSRGQQYGFLQSELGSNPGRQPNTGEGLYVLPVSSAVNGTQRKTSGCECPMCYHSGHNICGVCGCPNSLPPIPSPSPNSSNASQPPALPPKYRHSLGSEPRLGRPQSLEPRLGRPQSSEPRLGRPQSMSSRSIEAIYSTSLENQSFKGSLGDVRQVTLTSFYFQMFVCSCQNLTGQHAGCRVEAKQLVGRKPE